MVQYLSDTLTSANHICERSSTGKKTRNRISDDSRTHTNEGQKVMARSKHSRPKHTGAYGHNKLKDVFER